MRLIDISKINAIDLWGEDGDCHVVYDYDKIHSASTVEAIPISVLEDIKAEIINLKSEHINDSYDDGFQDCRKQILEIIRKHKNERYRYDKGNCTS